MKRLCAVVALAAACATPGAERHLARPVTLDGASVTLHRWGSSAVSRGRVLVVPEFGFDHRLVAPLCRRLRANDFSCFALDGRHVSTSNEGTARGLPAFALDVREALAASGATHLIAIGIAGSVAARAADGRVRGVVAVNVPFVFDIETLGLADAFADHGFQPASWLRTPAGPLLLGAGRSTPSRALLSLERLVRPLPAELARDVERLHVHRARVKPPSTPLRLLVGARDNLVDPRRALLPEIPARRLARIEYFTRDIGHLDWLVDPATFDEVFPVLLQQLEELP